MSGETGVQTASPSPNVAAEDVPEHPSDSDTETVTNETPTVQEVEDVDLDVPQVDNETKELNVQETTKLLEDEEMPTFTAISEIDEEKMLGDVGREKNDNSDKRSIHSSETVIDDSDGESMDHFPNKKILRNRDYDDSEDYSDEEDEDKSFEDEEEDSLDDEEMDEAREEEEREEDDCQVVEHLVSDDDCAESPMDSERASSDDFERRKNNITKFEIEGKKSLSCQNFTDLNFTSEPKKESAKIKVDNNRVINPMKNASKLSKPGPKSFKVQNIVPQHLKIITSVTPEERRKKEAPENNFKEAQQHENQVLGKQKQPTLKPIKDDEKFKLIEELKNSYEKANAEHDPKYADLRPISTEKDTEIRVPNPNVFNSAITILDEKEAKRIHNKIEKEEKKTVNGSTEQQDQINYNDHMKPQPSMAQFQQLLQENAAKEKQIEALKKQMEAMRWREHESKKKMCDVAVQTDPTRMSDTATSISDWSEFPSVSVPSLDHSTQTTNSQSDKLSNMFLTSSRILETFNAISTQLKSDESSTSFTPSSRKRKLPEEETEDMKCMIYKETENSAERSFVIEVQDPSHDEEKTDTQVNRKCGPYLIGNLEIMMSEFNGTINVWGKEVGETSQNTTDTSPTQNAALENAERRTLKARRSLNPKMVCSTEKKKSPPHEHHRPDYRNYACHSRRLECASPPRYHSHYNRCNCHSCRSSSSYQPVHEKRHFRCEHSRGHHDEAEHDYYDGQEPEMNRDRDYCCPTEDRATGSGSNAWNRVETTLYNGKVDSGVHSDTLSNQDEEPDYLQNLGFIDNKAKKRKITGKNFLDLLKSCGSEFRQTFTNRRNIPGHRPTTSTADFVQDTNRSVYMPTEQDRRFKSEKNRARPSAETKTARNLYPEPQGN